ncbi:MAG: glycosyl hydrolase family 18 protein [Chloroflexota bacterium]|nr:glycosyl hydrolase family 18 protein [Chloroflexota bacterium]
MQRRILLCLASLLGTLLLLLPLGSASPPAQAQGQADWDIPGGHFFTQTGGNGRGYAVTDEGGVPFWSEFKRLGGVAAVGYPVSQRFVWDGFVVQVFQRVVFQWHPDAGKVYFVNVFDRLGEMGADEWLLRVRQTPSARQWDEAGLTWDEIVRRRLAVLDAFPAIRTAYFGVVGDPIQANGLPTTAVVDMGNHYALRAQRVVFQQWKEDVPWARQGEVTMALGGSIAKEAGLLPEPGALEPTAPPSTREAASQRQVFAYYVPYDSTSWDSLVQHADMLDYVAVQWVRVDACGNIGSREDETLKQFAREKGVALLPSLLTSSGWLNHHLLTNQASRTRAINQIVSYVLEEGYAGFDLDLEGVYAEDRHAYTTFVAELARALHARDKLLTLAIPSKTREVTTGWAGAYDYAALGQHADLITIMSYDYRGAWSGPGPVAPYDWVNSVGAYATSQIPSHKVLLGVAFYGYDWNTTSGYPIRSLRYDQAKWLSDRYGVPLALDPTTRSATLRYSAPAGDPSPPGTLVSPDHDIKERPLGACGITPPPPGPPGPARATPPPDSIQEHEVWIEDSASAAARLELADRHRTGGIATWRLGQEDPRVWEILANWRAGR